MTANAQPTQANAERRYEVHRGWEPTGRLSDRLTLDLLMKSANR